MQLRQLNGWQIIPALVTISVVIAVIGMLVRVPRTAIAGAAVLLGGAAVATWMLDLV